jgi:flagellar basal-body rod protein FlgG
LNISTSYLKLEDDTQFTVGRDGLVFDGNFTTDRMAIIKFDKPEFLQKTGDNYFQYGDKRIGDGTFSSKSVIHQGELEKSNVKSVDEMVKMIALYRSFEMQQKLVQTQDDALGKAVNNIARIG